MNHFKILSCSTTIPGYSRSTQEIIPFVQKWLEHESPRQINKAVKIFEMSQVNQRFSILPIEEVFTKRSYAIKNKTYVEEMKILTEKALKDAIIEANLEPKDIDAIITVSCTGFMIPSMDAYLVNKLKLKYDIMRLPVTEMGCAGGTSAMIYAHQYIRSNPGKNVALVAFESPTSTMQHDDVSMTNIVSSAIFGDGVSAMIIGPSEQLRPAIVDSMMYHFYDEEDMMGFELVETGLKMILSVELPNKIEKNFHHIYEPFLKRNNVSIDEIAHLPFHPGGKKIIRLIEEKFENSSEKLKVSKEILYHYGNMSSATIFYVLKAYLSKDIKKNDLGLVLSFGPGFTAQLILLRWT